MIHFYLNVIVLLMLNSVLQAQVSWKDVTSQYGPLPQGIQLFKTTDAINGKYTIAFMAKIDLKSHAIRADVDTTKGRRLTPDSFYNKNDKPALVVNCSFFEFVNNSNLNILVRNKKILTTNAPFVAGRGKDTFYYFHPLGSALGMNRRGYMDVAWLYTTKKRAYALQNPVPAVKDSSKYVSRTYLQKKWKQINGTSVRFKKWKMQLAVGGGPVLVQNGKIAISNNEEKKFSGKAIEDTHPRTAIGYTKNRELIILVVQGRFPGLAEGVTLKEEAQLFVDAGCIEAINLDGGGSSCMLINGKETITPSDKTGQRPLPAIFMIH